MILAKTAPKSMPDRLMRGVAILLFAYTATRAHTLSMTFDEARTFLNLDDRYLPDVGTSNTHYLNSLLMKVCSLLLGDSPLVHRLPNLASHLVFLGYGMLALAPLRSRVLALAAFVLIQANPYVLDFFSIGRGYGLALAFAMGSLAHAAQSSEARDVRWALGLGIAAALANLSFTTYLLALIGALALRGVLDGRPRTLKQALRAAWDSRGLALVGGLAVVWALFSGLDLQHRGELIWGGRHGFFRDTVVGLAAATLYLDGRGLATELAWAVTVVVTSGGALLLHAVWTFRRIGSAGVLFVIAALCVLGPVAQHAWLGTYHLAERTALLFIPTLGLAAAVGWDHGVMALRPSGQRLVGLLASGAAALMLVHGARVASLDRTFHFSFNDGVDEVPGLIRAITGDAPGHQEIGVQWTNGVTLDYYKRLANMPWLQVNRVDKPFRYDLGLDRQFISDRAPTPFRALHYSHHSPGRFLLLQSPVAEAVLARHPRLIRIAYWPISRLYLLQEPPGR